MDPPRLQIPFEGACASRNPFCSIPGSLTAAPGGLAMGRFGWVDSAAHTVGNVYTSGALGGIVIPQIGMWTLVYCVVGVRYLREGNPVTVASKGDFYLRFPSGAIIGAQVYADPATGIAYAYDGGGFVPMPWKVVTDAAPGALGIVSPYQHFS